MKRTVVKGLLVAAMLAGAGAPVMAEERRPPPMGQDDHRDGKRDEKGREGRKDGPREGFGIGGNPGLKLAERLSGLETYIGITAEKAPAWRSYTDALIAFAEADMPASGPRGEVPAPGAKPEGAPGEGQPPQLMAERIAERAIAKGERAEKLQSAAATLRRCAPASAKTSLPG